MILEGGSDGDSDLEIDASQYKKRRSRDGRSEEDEEGMDEDDDDGIVNQQLLLSIEDVKVIFKVLCSLLIY